MSYHPDVRLIPPNTTSGEIAMMATVPQWKSAVGKFDKYFINPGSPKQTIHFKDFASYIGEGWIDFLIKKFEVPPGHLFLKEPCISGLEHFFDLFPHSKLILLVRDGRDQAASYMKAALARRKTTTRTARTRAIVNHLVWRDFILVVRGWRNAVISALAFDKQHHAQRGKSYIVLRYEDVYQNPQEKMAQVFDFAGLDYDDAMLAKLTEAEVVGSCFLSPDQTENAIKPNWIPTPKSKHFKPLGRWKQWSHARKAVFKKIAGQQLIDLGYERDFKW